MTTKKTKETRYFVLGANDFDSADYARTMKEAETAFRDRTKTDTFQAEEAVFVLRLVRVYRPKVEPEYIVEDFV